MQLTQIMIQARTRQSAFKQNEKQKVFPFMIVVDVVMYVLSGQFSGTLRGLSAHMWVSVM